VTASSAHASADRSDTVLADKPKRKVWQKRAAKKVKKDADPRSITWYYDRPGTKGKSTEFRPYLIEKYGAIQVKATAPVEAMTKIAEAWHDEESKFREKPIVIVDLPRGSSHLAQQDKLYEMLESIKSGFPSKSGDVSWGETPPHVIVFANVQPASNKLAYRLNGNVFNITEEMELQECTYFNLQNEAYADHLKAEAAEEFEACRTGVPPPRLQSSGGTSGGNDNSEEHHVRSRPCLEHSAERSQRALPRACGLPAQPTQAHSPFTPPPASRVRIGRPCVSTPSSVSSSARPEARAASVTISMRTSRSTPRTRGCSVSRTRNARRL
jgi:hypothetical protein